MCLLPLRGAWHTIIAEVLHIPYAYILFYRAAVFLLPYGEAERGLRGDREGLLIGQLSSHSPMERSKGASYRAAIFPLPDGEAGRGFL